MNNAEKEAYLREYEILKKEGKPFFPYAVFKDSAMMFLVAIILVAMSLILGAEQGPKADPTTTTYVPRPEWYFFFLFELLRVIKPPALVPVATVGIPTIAMVLLLLLPFAESLTGLVLELIEGPTLAERIAQGPLPIDEVLSIARQMAEALEAAHEQGIIHRDLKPANIKVRDDGTVKTPFTQKPL